MDELQAAIDEGVVIHHNHYNVFESKMLGFAHRLCNGKQQNTNLSNHSCKINFYAHNSSSFDLQVILPGLKLSLWKTKKLHLSGKSANGVRYMTIDERFYFRDTLMFFQESLDTLAASSTPAEATQIKDEVIKFLSYSSVFSETYESLSKEEQKEVVETLSKKGCIPYEMFKNGSELNWCTFPEKECFDSQLRGQFVDVEVYERVKRLWVLLKMKDLNQLLHVYNFSDVVTLTVIAQNRFASLRESSLNLEPKNFSSMATYSQAVGLLYTHVILTGPNDCDKTQTFYNSIYGGYSATPTRLAFDTVILPEDPKIKIDSKLFGLEGGFEDYKVLTSLEKVDENNQYGYAMTKPLGVGGIKSASIPVKDDMDSMGSYNAWLIKCGFDVDSRGHLFEVSFLCICVFVYGCVIFLCNLQFV